MEEELKLLTIDVSKLLQRIVQRNGAGHRIALRISQELETALGNDDQDKAVEGIIRFYAKIVQAPSYRHYITNDDFEEVQRLTEHYMPMLPGLDKQIQGAIRYSESDAPKKQKLTTDILEEYFRENGIRLRRNAITHQVEITGWNDDGALPKEREEEHFPTMLEDALGETYTGAKKDNIRDRIALIADKHLYNPFLELLGAETWDGQDRTPELFEVLGITEDKLSCLLVEKWMRQVVALQYNGREESFGGEGVLVLCGAQGCGKSEFARRISNIDGKGRYFLPGAILDPKDKDSLMQCTSRLVVELGELPSTFKSDIGRLKAFVTNSSDTYRVPYGKAETTTPRHTSYIATVDRLDFLVDDSGNRRWLVVEVEKIDLDRLDKIDLLQLWRQIAAKTMAEGLQSFRLSAAEREELNKRNANHERSLPGETELRDILAQYYRGIPTHHRFEGEAKLSGSQIVAEYSELSKFSAQQIGRALIKIGVVHGIARGTTWYMFPKLQVMRGQVLPVTVK